MIALSIPIRVLNAKRDPKISCFCYSSVKTGLVYSGSCLFFLMKKIM